VWISIIILTNIKHHLLFKNLLTELSTFFIFILDPFYLANIFVLHLYLLFEYSVSLFLKDFLIIVFLLKILKNQSLLVNQVDHYLLNLKFLAFLILLYLLICFLFCYLKVLKQLSWGIDQNMKIKLNDWMIIELNQVFKN
jgi:hypothetical protein